MTNSIDPTGYGPEGAPTPMRREENVIRGGLFAIVVLPVGVAAWLLLWSGGFVASIVAFGVAWAAVKLYQFGAGTISRVGAYVIGGIVVVTLLLSFWGGMVLDFATGGASQLGVSAGEFFASSRFWPLFSENFGSVWANDYKAILLGVAFAALGSYSTLSRAFRVARLNAPAPVVAPPIPPVPHAPGTALGVDAAPDAKPDAAPEATTEERPAP